MPTVALTKRLQRLRDCCRVMAKIINHLNAPHFATELQSTRDPSKTLERSVDFRLWHIVKPCCHRGHCSIMNIEFADERNFESVFPELEPRAFGGVSHLTYPLRAIFRETDLDHLRQAIFGHLDAIGIVAVQQHHSILRNNVEQTPEAQLDFIEILEDVRVIELDVVYDHEFREVMNKL